MLQVPRSFAVAQDDEWEAVRIVCSADFILIAAGDTFPSEPSEPFEPSEPGPRSGSKDAPILRRLRRHPFLGKEALALRHIALVTLRVFP